MKSARFLIFSALVTVILSACNGSSEHNVPEGDLQALHSASDEIDYRFQIGTRQFDPQAGAPADFLPRVEQSIQKRQSNFSAAPAKAYILIQFFEPLSRGINKQLESGGVDVLNRINAFTWIASANLFGSRSLLSNSVVRWADLYPADAKPSAEARRPEPFDWQFRNNGQAAYSVLFHSDVGADEADSLRGAIPELDLEDFDSQAFQSLKTANVVINPDQLDDLASIPVVRWIEPVEPPLMDFNFDHAQPTSHVDVVQEAPYNLTGRGVTVGIWEVGGVIDTTPLDLAGRVIVQSDQAGNSSDHAVHVAGTVGASGGSVEKAEGMATRVTMASWDVSKETKEMRSAASSSGNQGDPTPIRASNHSYGTGIGWYGNGTKFRWNQYIFGRYTNRSQDFDRIVLDTDLIILVAAGNDRNDAPPNPVKDQPADCFQGGLGIAADCMTPRASAKNVLAVGATFGTDVIAEFSNFGPTDDGRIKPDLMAHGVRTLSLACNCFDDGNDDGSDDVPNSTTATDSMSGTSMATPVVTGVVALLLEQATLLNMDLTSAGMKALMIQTAQDMANIGQAKVGPDYATGWGILDARAAADLLRLPSGPGVLQDTLGNTGPESAYEHDFLVSDGLPEIRVTLAWTDREGDPSNTTGNPQLVNDLDLRLIAPEGTVFTPWVLDPAKPGDAAVRNGGDDNCNNVEQVSVLKPTGGAWTVQVSAKAGSLVFGPQPFALAGPLSTTPAAAPN